MSHLIRLGQGLLLVLAVAWTGCQGWQQLGNAGSSPVPVPTGTVYHVAPTGTEEGNGSVQSPFRSIQQAADRLQPGDVCLIHAGEYRETVTPPVSGTVDKPIRFVAAPGANVLIRGTETIIDWQRHTGGVYRAAVDWTVDQVFVDNCRMFPASWPDPGFDPFHPSFLPVTIDETEVRSDQLNFPAGAWVGGVIWGFSDQLGWVAGSARITDSAPGRLTLDKRIPWLRKGSGRVVLTGTEAALTVAREWYQQDGVLYLYPPGTADPSVLGVEVTRRRWAFNLAGLSHVQVSGVRLHAASINLDGADHCVVDNIRARYPSFQQFMRGGFNRDHKINTESEGVGLALGGRHNIIRDSVVSHATGDGISIWGVSNSVVNCVIHHCNSSASDCAPITCTGIGHQILSNTVFHAARSLILHRKLAQGRICHNHLSNAGLLCRDLGMTYTYQTDGHGTEIAFNRMHDNLARPPSGVGIYLDDTSQRHIVHHNLVFNTSEALAMNPPNSQHNLVFNNTLIGTLAGVGMGANNQNLTGSRIFNNIFRPHISSTVLRSPHVFLANNIANARQTHFRDPANGDYTLAPGSSAIDAGREFAPYTDGFNGSAPDLGAFESGHAAWSAGSTIPVSEWGLQAQW